MQVDALTFGPFVAVIVWPYGGKSMPKLFPIHIEVEELAVGKVMRQLHNTPGVAKINLDMGAPKLNGAGAPRGPYKTRKQSVTSDETGQDLVGKTLLGKPPMRRKQLMDAFAAQGRSRSSINSVLYHHAAEW